MPIVDKLADLAAKELEDFAQNNAKAQWVSVRSTAIDRVKFSKGMSGDGTMEIAFTHGGVYTFPNVPEEIYEGLIHAPSPGRFYHDMIKGQYG